MICVKNIKKKVEEGIKKAFFEEITELNYRQFLSKGVVVDVFPDEIKEKKWYIRVKVDSKVVPAYFIKKINFLALGEDFSNEFGEKFTFVGDGKNFLFNSQKSEKKERYELHVHTKMSTMNGISNVEEYLNGAVEKGVKGIVIADTNSVQSFPRVKDFLDEKSKKERLLFKVGYGVEMEMLPERIELLGNCSESRANESLYNSVFIAIDTETTGLSPHYDELIEFGWHTIESDRKKESVFVTVDKGSFLINNPYVKHNWSSQINKITVEQIRKEGKNYTDSLNKIVELLSNKVIVVYNAQFDVSFINRALVRDGKVRIDSPVIDVLQLARLIQHKKRSYSLENVSKRLGVKLDQTKLHGAFYDSYLLSEVFKKIFEKLLKGEKIGEIKGVMIKKLGDIQPLLNLEKFGQIYLVCQKVIVIAKNSRGLKDIYEIITRSHTDWLYSNEPTIQRRYLQRMRKKGNIIIGSHYQGEIFDAIVSAEGEQIVKEKMKLYDYVEICPLGKFRGDSLSIDSVSLAFRKIVDLAKKLNILVTAVSDSHYVNSDDVSIFLYSVIVNSINVGGKLNSLYFRSDLPDNHLYSCEELEDGVNFFIRDKSITREIVYVNPKLIFCMMENIEDIFTVGKVTPCVNNSYFYLATVTKRAIIEKYGTSCAVAIKRAQQELMAVRKGDHAHVLILSYMLIKYLRERKIEIGSRGSVGSSFIGWLLGITEVNPLPPHYYCNGCKSCLHDKKFLDSFAESGYDLDRSICSRCGSSLRGEGQNIPFETFFGTSGTRNLDIDINIDSEFQKLSHRYLLDVWKSFRWDVKGNDNFNDNPFGIRAGTISTLAPRLALNCITGYLTSESGKKWRDRWKEQFGSERSFEFKDFKENLSHRLSGVKRTTGQHPGGIILLPSAWKDDKFHVNNITPLNYPSNRKDDGWLTTHFDIDSISSKLAKIDLLAHDSPRMLRMMSKVIKNRFFSEPLFSYKDKGTVALFNRFDTLGIPEFGTPFVQNLMKVVRSRKGHSFNFSDLVRISGLTHGRNIIYKYGRLAKGGRTEMFELYLRDKIRFVDLISNRDDIMNYLISKRVDRAAAFQIAESVKKGGGIPPQYEEDVRRKVPAWYVNSCNTISYLFPKSHSTAYVMMAWKIAWFKAHWPAIFYAAYLSTQAKSFEITTMMKSGSRQEDVRRVILRLRQIERKRKNWGKVETFTNEEKTGVFPLMPKSIAHLRELEDTLKITLEMISEHKISIFCPNLEYSHPTEFKVVDKKTLQAPLITVNSLGNKIAESIYKYRFTFVDEKDFKKKGSVNKRVLGELRRIGMMDSYYWKQKISFLSSGR